MADAVAPKGRWSRRVNTILDADETVRELNATINYLNALTQLDQTLGTTLDTWDIQLAY